MHVFIHSWRRESPRNNYCLSKYQSGMQLSAFRVSFHIILILQPRNKGAINNLFQATRSRKWLIRFEPGSLTPEKPAGEGLTPHHAEGCKRKPGVVGSLDPCWACLGSRGAGGGLHRLTTRISREASAQTALFLCEHICKSALQRKILPRANGLWTSCPFILSVPILSRSLTDNQSSSVS